MAAIRPSSGKPGKCLLLAWMLIFVPGMLFAQDGAFKTLRYEEDYSQFAHDSLMSPYKKVKYIPLAWHQSYLSLGGEVRYQYFHYQNPGWGAGPQRRDGFVLSRFLAHADLHLGGHFRIFSQIQSSMAAGSNVQNSPVDENPLDVHQLFADFDLFKKEKTRLALKVGRQELSYGSQRLISVREGPNNRQAFDAFRLVFTQNHLRADAFYSTYVKARKNVFDERFWDPSRRLWGAYITSVQKAAAPNFDAYYLGVGNNNSFVDGTGLERRHSFGARIWKKAERLEYDFETVYQFGGLSASRISAWTASLNMSSRLRIFRLDGTLGMKTELISGDRKSGDNVINTFNPLYPRGAYFGLASLIGPYNLSDLHPYLEIELVPRVTWAADVDFFWRMSRNDGIYAVNGQLIHDGHNLFSTDIGRQLGTDISIRPNRFLNFSFEFTWFDAGQFLRAAGLGKDIYMAGITAAIKY